MMYVQKNNRCCAVAMLTEDMREYCNSANAALRTLLRESAAPSLLLFLRSLFLFRSHSLSLSLFFAFSISRHVSKAVATHAMKSGLVPGL
jgi:hypothetical protein